MQIADSRCIDNYIYTPCADSFVFSADFRLFTFSDVITWKFILDQFKSIDIDVSKKTDAKISVIPLSILRHNGTVDIDISKVSSIVSMSIFDIHIPAQ
jgi:hypothetical protein